MIAGEELGVILEGCMDGWRDDDDDDVLGREGEGKGRGGGEGCLMFSW